MEITTLSEVGRLLGASFDGCDSASLRLEKYVRLGKTDAGDETKLAEITSVTKKRQDSIPVFNGIDQVPDGARQFMATLGGRLIVNQAGGVIENAGLCLHRHFNAPYIPGRALKGVSRHAAWEAWNAENDLQRKKDLAEEIAAVFGYPTGDKRPPKDESERVYLDEMLEALYRERVGDAKAKRPASAGNVAFMAAVPADKAPLAVDMVNCHHHKYYAKVGNDDSSDTENPIPNFFPVVESGRGFVFTLMPIRGRDELVAKAEFWLKRAIQENGVGAKTSAGYGWFVYDEVANENWKKKCTLVKDAQKLNQRLYDLQKRIMRLQDIKDDEMDKLKREIASCKKEADELARQERPLDHACLQELKSQEGRLPQLSPLDKLRERWTERGVGNVVVDDLFRKFHPATDENHWLVVELLRENDGIGHDVWLELKRVANDGNRKNKYKHIPGVVQAIMAFSKSVPGWGKMP